MLKILFAILKLFPQGLALIQQHNAAENAKLEKALGEYQVKAISLAADIANLRAEASQYQAQAESAALRIVDIQATLTAREIEIERLKNETQQRLRAVAALDSESVFNASLLGSRGQDGAPLAERQLPVDGRRH